MYLVVSVHPFVHVSVQALLFELFLIILNLAIEMPYYSRTQRLGLWPLDYDGQVLVNPSFGLTANSVGRFQCNTGRQFLVRITVSSGLEITPLLHT